MRLFFRRAAGLKENKTLTGIQTLSGFIYAFLFYCLFFFSCSDHKTVSPGQRVLARVGDREITVDEFKYSYEFSFAPLRFGEDSKLLYLDRMIDELLLANEGYYNGLHHSRYVIRRVRRRKSNDLLQAFYQKYVYSRVKIPEQELQEAIKKASINWRMIIWPVNSRLRAEQIIKETEKSSLEDYIDQQLKKQEVPVKNKKFFETDWLDFYDVRPQVLSMIENLEIGKTSDPIPCDDGFILVQILDINLHGIKEDDLKFGAKRKKMYKRLFNVRADSISSVLMDSVLTPRQVRVKGAIIEQLVSPLYQWVKNGLPGNKSLIQTLQDSAGLSAGHLKKINKLLDRTLVTTIDSNISVRAYLDYMNYYRRTLNQSRSEKDFRQRLITEIGRMIKNKTFIAIAEREGFSDLDSIKTDVYKWERKWTYDMQRFDYVKDIEVTREELDSFFKNRWRDLDIANVDTTRFYKYEAEAHNIILHEKHIAFLKNKLDKLKLKYPVWVDTTLLKSIEVDATAKSQEISMFVAKKFSGEAVVPIVDSKWVGY